MTNTNRAAFKPSKLSVHVGPDMTTHEAHVALGEIADLVKALRVAGKSSSSSTQLPEGTDALLSEAIQALFAAQRLLER